MPSPMMLKKMPPVDGAPKPGMPPSAPSPAGEMLRKKMQEKMGGGVAGGAPGAKSRPVSKFPAPVTPLMKPLFGGKMGNGERFNADRKARKTFKDMHSPVGPDPEKVRKLRELVKSKAA